MEFNSSNKYIESALNARALRQDLISSNIANVDTPYYRSKDIDFETVLAKEAHREFEKGKHPMLEMAKTSRMHLNPMQDFDNLNPTIFYRDGHLARNDGNTVDIDVETTELSKNNIMYSALTQAHKRNKVMFHAAIESGRNL
jgi:flagellar basal-body rod protein FlgB